MAGAPKGRGRGPLPVAPPPPRSVPLKLDEDWDFQLVRRMRAVLGEGEAIAPFVELPSVGGGSPVRFNALMMCLTSARYRHEGSACFQHIAHEVRDRAEGALEKLRDLVHLGSVEFGGSRKQLYDACYLAELLEMPECESVLYAALALRGPSCRVALEVAHDKAVAEQLRDLHRAYPAEVPRGRFDTIFSLQGAGSPCMQAHRLVLVAASGYFRALLWHGTPDGPDEPWRIELAGISEVVVREALSLVYLGRAAVPREHFPAFAIQADGWEMPLASEACWAAFFEDASLGELLLDEAGALPENLTVAVAYSHPNVLARQDDVDRFAMLVMTPALATHLSLSFARGYMDSYELDWADWRWGPLAGLPASLANGMLRGREKGDFKHTKGFGRAYPLQEQKPVGTQLEQFIDGPGFRTFLAHSAALKLPAWSVAMILESLIVRLTDYNPGHPSFGSPTDHSFRGRGKGRRPFRISWHPADWAETRTEVVGWLLAWAAHQQGVVGDCPTQALLKVRSAMWHRRGAANGEDEYRGLWLDVFRRALRLDTGTFERLLLDSDEHFTQGRSLPRGKRYLRPEADLASKHWAARHACYEAAFLNAAEDLKAPPLAPGLSWPLTSVSAKTLVRLLASEAAPTDPDCVRAVVRRWLEGGPDALLRSMALVGAASGTQALLRHPRKDHGSLRHIRPRAGEDLWESLVELDVVGEGGQTRPPP